MAVKTPSPDPVRKITISIPRSLRERAQKRLNQFGMNFSEYLQYLISADVTLAPSELRRYFRTREGNISFITAESDRGEYKLRVAEDDPDQARAKK